MDCSKSLLNNFLQGICMIIKCDKKDIKKEKRMFRCLIDQRNALITRGNGCSYSTRRNAW